MEIVRFKNFQIKAALVILGALAGYPTIIAGLVAESLIKNPDASRIIEVHEKFAISTIVIFSLIAADYLWAIYRKDYIVRYTKVIWILALLGFICVMTTGALGGSIVYGTTNDPVTGWIYHLFFK